MSAVRLKDVHKSFPHASGEVKVLKGLNLEVPRGERLAIVGPSGSGKSTLLAVLAGLERPEQGEVTLADRSLSELGEDGLSDFRSRQLGIVFQQFHLLPHLTAEENVALPLEILGEGRALEPARHALERVRMSHRQGHFPTELSGGECQRVAIARATVSQPEILLADEPSGNLDRETGDLVMQTLFEELGQSTLLLVTHNETLAASCDRCLHMNDGRLSDAPSTPSA